MSTFKTGKIDDLLRERGPFSSVCGLGALLSFSVKSDDPRVVLFQVTGAWFTIQITGGVFSFQGCVTGSYTDSIVKRYPDCLHKRV